MEVEMGIHRTLYIEIEGRSAKVHVGFCDGTAIRYPDG